MSATRREALAYAATAVGVGLAASANSQEPPKGERQRSPVTELKTLLDVRNLKVVYKDAANTIRTMDLPSLPTELLVDAAWFRAATPLTYQRMYEYQGIQFSLTLEVSPPPAPAHNTPDGQELFIVADFSLDGNELRTGQDATITLTDNTKATIVLKKSPAGVTLINVNGGINIKTGPIKIGF